jgi:hypothetical protein
MSLKEYPSVKFAVSFGIKILMRLKASPLLLSFPTMLRRGLDAWFVPCVEESMKITSG